MRKLGDKRHSLTYIKTISKGKNGKPGAILCRCDCGKEKIIKHNKFGITKSCGCLKNRKGESYPSFSGYKEIYGRQWWQIQKNANKRNIAFYVTIEEAWEIYKKQKRLCNLSKLPIEFGMKNWTASLDRVDSSKEYTKDNIQWLHIDINKIKMDLPQKHFIKLCKLIAQNN